MALGNTSKCYKKSFVFLIQQCFPIPYLHWSLSFLHTNRMKHFNALSLKDSCHPIPLQQIQFSPLSVVTKNHSKESSMRYLKRSGMCLYFAWQSFEDHKDPNESVWLGSNVQLYFSCIFFIQEANQIVWTAFESWQPIGYEILTFFKVKTHNLQSIF